MISNSFLRTSHTHCTLHWHNSPRKWRALRLDGRTWEVPGFMMTDSNSSSGLKCFMCSNRIATFFSLSQPDGLRDRERERERQSQTNHKSTPITSCHAPPSHEDGILVDHPGRFFEGHAVCAMEQVLVQEVHIPVLFGRHVEQCCSIWQPQNQGTFSHSIFSILIFFSFFFEYVEKNCCLFRMHN